MDSKGMNKSNLNDVLVVGAGITGLGIAQVAAQAGHNVLLFDVREGVAVRGRDQLTQTLGALAAKGKIKAQDVDQTLSRIAAIASLESAATVGLVVEAIVEKIEAKRSLFQQLEGIVAPDCVLATNTSSISVTAIANGLKHPGRLVGMHFFNPVPLMKRVEVVSGLQTDPAVAQAIFEVSQSWGKVAVHARSTPGFIVNRIARPYYAETLALLQEQAGTPGAIDACLRAAGFRMGPCELIDLIGHDTNFSVTQSVYEANFCDKRYVPSGVQREMVDGGLLGRKSGRGFFDYREGAVKPAAAAVPGPAPTAQAVGLHGQGPLAERFAVALTLAGVGFVRCESSDWTGLEVDGAQLRLSDGRTASQLGVDVAVFDLPLATAPGAALAWAPSLRASLGWMDAVPRWLQLLGFAPQRLGDAPGLVVARTIAMLINEAADAVYQGVCTAEGADAAMKLGVNYPAGPFEWLARWNSNAVVALLDALDGHYRGERYRVSPWLHQRVSQRDNSISFTTEFS
jgi:3-hydroxybutyryl-CoA dehydrogenase